MFASRNRVEDYTRKVDQAAQEAAYRNYGHAAASIRLDAQSSITPDPLGESAPPGQPPNTRRGQLKRAIRYSVDRFGSVIGPSANVVDDSGAAHEHGGRYKQETFDPRPYMYPALLRNLNRFAGRWQGSVRAY